jgi:hypothetical protein
MEAEVSESMVRDTEELWNGLQDKRLTSQVAAKTGMNSNDDKRAPEYRDADRQAKRQTKQQPEGRTVVPATRTRQAVVGHNARYVLVFGLAAVVMVFFALYLVYFIYLR